jgi:dihydroorotase
VTAPSIVLRGGDVVDQTGRRRADVLVLDGSIAAVEPDLDVPTDARVLDAAGCLVLPGLVDLQVHWREPGGEEAETIETGSRAAALGGVTAAVTMPNTTPCIDTPDMVRTITERAEAVGLCQVLPSAAMSVGRAGERLVDFGALWDAGVRLFTDDGCSLMDTELMRQAFLATKELPGAYLGQHAEDESLVAGGHLHAGAVAEALGLRGRPAEAEEIVVARDLILARATGGRYHVLHLSTAEGAALVRAAKAAGVAVTAEATPQHLTLTDETLRGGDATFKMNPPLRPQRHLDALQRALADGTIDAVATDHAPHPTDAKARPIDEAPPGMTGLETSLAVLHTELVLGGHLDLEMAVGALSWRPAAIGGLDAMGHGGPIAPGSAANLAVFDPTERWVVDPATLGSKGHNNPYRGRELTGRVRHTVLAGDPVVVDAVAQR